MLQLLPYIEQDALFKRWTIASFGNNERDENGIQWGRALLLKQNVEDAGVPSQPIGTHLSQPVSGPCRPVRLTSYYACAGIAWLPATGQLRPRG